MKKFIAHIPAHVLVTIEARDQKSALRKAKALEGSSISVLDELHYADVCSDRVILGKMDIGSDFLGEKK